MMLQHIKIIELGSHIAAPAAAGLLADWGAQVIKVEQAARDAIRWLFTVADPEIGNPVFEMNNRGKRSIPLDYGKPEGRELLDSLIGDADIFITNRLPGSLKRAGFDYETLHARYPGLIYTSVTGYGLEGPAANVGSFDIQAFWSRSGLGGQMWPEGSEHLNWRPGIGDHVTAMAAALGTMAALLDRERTGKGQLVDSSLIRAGAYIGGFDIADQLRLGRTPPASSRSQGEGRPSTYYLSKDRRWICLWAKDIDEWRTIFDIVGRADLAADPRFCDFGTLTLNGGALTPELDRAFALLSAAEIAERFTAAGVTWAPVLRVAEVVEDELAEAAGCFVAVDDGHGGQYRAPAPPVRVPGGDGPKGRPPRVGEHGDAILAELGLDPERIASLRAGGIVGG